MGPQTHRQIDMFGFFFKVIVKEENREKKFIFYGPFNFKSFVVVFF